MPEDRWITAREATELTARLARLYGKVGERTPARDLNDLFNFGLVQKDKRLYRARRGVIRAFIPPTWEASQKALLDEMANTAPTDDPTLFDD